MPRLVVAVSAVRHQAQVLSHLATATDFLAGRLPAPAMHILDPHLRAAGLDCESAVRAAVESIRDDLLRLADATALTAQIYADAEMTGVARWTGSHTAARVGPVARDTGPAPGPAA
jgi:hypothetical protein